MRPGSCPRQPLSPPVLSRSMRQAIAASLPIVLALILLPLLAFASPPDPSWVAGFYDDADGDDVVSLVYETSAASQTVPSHLGPLPCLLVLHFDGIDCHVPDRHFTRGPRSPPVLRSPAFMSVFNSLRPSTSFTKTPVTLPSLAKFRRLRCCREMGAPWLRPSLSTDSAASVTYALLRVGQKCWHAFRAAAARAVMLDHDAFQQEYPLKISMLKAPHDERFGPTTRHQGRRITYVSESSSPRP